MAFRSQALLPLVGGVLALGSPAGEGPQPGGSPEGGHRVPLGGHRSAQTVAVLVQSWGALLHTVEGRGVLLEGGPLGSPGAGGLLELSERGSSPGRVLLHQDRVGAPQLRRLLVQLQEEGWRWGDPGGRRWGPLLHYQVKIRRS